MAPIKTLLIALILTPFAIKAQYTDVINSNRPGVAQSAYAVGKNVVQAEAGFLYESREHSRLNTESSIFGGELALRYGFLFEQLEFIYEAIYVNENITFNNFGTEESRTDFTQNRLGAKYLVFDPFKNEENNKPNLYSWRANNKFQLKNLVPAVSLYGGATFNLGDNPFNPEDDTISYRGMIATQSKLSPRSVFIINVAYDRITTDDPELSYIISLSHSFRNPKWSIFVEHQGIDSDRFADLIIRTGIGHLFTKNFQADLSFGASFKDTPSRYFIRSGVSYRLDFHKDELKAINEQKAKAPKDSGNKIPKKKKKDLKKKKKKKDQ